MIFIEKTCKFVSLPTNYKLYIKWYLLQVKG